MGQHINALDNAPRTYHKKTCRSGGKHGGRESLPSQLKIELDKLSRILYYIVTRCIALRSSLLIEEPQMTESSNPEPESFLPLSPPVFHILMALVDEERHGYGIMQEVLFRTNGQVHLVPGTLYGAIKRLLKQKLIEETDERPDPELNDERRRYYELTDFGQHVLAAEAERLARLVEQAQAKELLPGWSSNPLPGGG